jgi:transposase
MQLAEQTIREPVVRPSAVLIEEPPLLGVHNFCPDQEHCSLLREVLDQKEKIEAENEKLRQIFSLARQEFEKRNKRIEYLEQELSILRELERENKDLKQQLEQAQAKANLFSRMLYGRKSEKDQLPQAGSGSNNTPDLDEDGEEFIFEDGTEAKEKKKRGAKPGHKGSGRNMPKNLPIEDHIVDIPQDQKKCGCCGKPLTETPELDQVSFEISKKVIYFIKRIIRKAYKKTCDCDQTRVLTIAPPPPKIIPKGKFSIEFWSDCLVNKYMLHLPVQRQLLDMKQHGLIVPAGTIFGGFERLHSLYLEPLYQAMAVELRKASRWHADESRWYIFIELEGKDNHKWMMWCFSSKDIVLFVLDPTRAADVPCRVLFDMNIEELEKAAKGKPLFESRAKVSKILNADRYSAYKRLQRALLLLIAYCWAHVRRDFVDVQTKYPLHPELCAWAQAWILRIGELYHINKERIKHEPGEPAFIEQNEKLKTALNQMFLDTQKEYGHQAQIDVMNSMKEHWEGLILFVEHPELDMDNNFLERMLRPMVLGRNSYWGNHSLWGGQLSAAMFSIVQTCHMHNISPKAYLDYYFSECAKRGAAPSKEEIDSFLPHNLSPDIREKLRMNRVTERAPGS